MEPLGFQERMEIGRQQRKRHHEKFGSSSVLVLDRAEYERRRGAGHDDRSDVPYWEPEDVMSDDDWWLMEAEEAKAPAPVVVGPAVDATGPGGLHGQTEEGKPCGPQPDIHPRRKRKARPQTSHKDPALADGVTMTGQQYVAACNKLGITPGYGAAKVLGISLAMTQRYAKGSWPIPMTVAKLLRALVKLGTTEI